MDDELADLDLDPEGPGEHDAHLLDDDGEPDLVTCPECGAAVSAYTEICHKCGYAFPSGEAWKNEGVPGRQNPWTPRIVFVCVGGLILLLLIGALR